MPKYIDKDKLVNRLKECCATLVMERWFDDYVHGYSAAISDIMDEPTEDIQEVNHGEWLLKHVGAGHYWECSVCHTNPCIYVTENTKYCPTCGAKMDLKG